MSEWGTRSKRTEPAVLRHFVDKAIFSHLVRHDEYGLAVAEHFMQTVPEAERRTSKATGRGKTKLDFPLPVVGDSDDTIAAKYKAASRKVWSYLNGEGYLPAVMTRSCIAALPEPLQADCRKHIAHDDGYLLIPINLEHGDAGAIHEEYADTARTGGKLRANDGAINEKDSEADLRRHEKELLDLIESTTAELVLVRRAIEKKGAGYA